VNTLHDLVKAASTRSPGAPAFVVPQRPVLDYRTLYDQIAVVQRDLRAAGLSAQDRVATVLPNGAEMALAFLGIASAAACAPLNPSYLYNELAFYLEDLGARGLVVSAGTPAASRAVACARNLGLATFLLESDAKDPAGVFRLRLLGEARSKADAARAPAPDDVALILHTSGTTSRPKKVPLSQRNICASSDNIVRALSLTPHDRCLNAMPLFHIHGLMAGVVATVRAGASICFDAGFQAARFLDQLEEFKPTWYTAVPSIHHAVLAEAKRRFEGGVETSLRFIRSSSSPLPPAVMKDLESTFGVPVIEAYGMTEAAHQIASNPLPPGQRKAGFVGQAAGPEVAIMGPAGALLGPGPIGEIVMRGDNVFAAYEGNEQANAEAFHAGWFRTGDQGLIDADGFVQITGRIKEIINQGGEKVSPREVDEALLSHAAVAQAVAFPVPHPTLGEMVAAAVVLADHETTTEAELRAFAAARLAAFKVPSRIALVKEIPKGPTGKIQRHLLAPHFAALLADEYAPPGTEAETLLARIWSEILGVERVGVTDSFFGLGGDSLSAVRIVAAAREHQLEITVAGLLERPTIRSLLEARDPQGARASVWIQRASGSKRLFLLHESSGNPWAYRFLAGYGKDWSIVALESPDRDWVQDSLSIAELVVGHVNEIRRIQPRGPYFLGGWSSGALLAFEAARRLARDGQETRQIVFLDPSPAPSARSRLRLRYRLALPRILASVPFGRARLDKKLERTQFGRLNLVLVHLFGKPSFTSSDLLRGLRLAWPDRYRDAGYDIMDVEALLRDLTDLLPTVLRQNVWEALLANSSQRGPAGVFKALHTWKKNANMSRLHKPTGSLDAQVDAYVVDGRSEHALTWRRYVEKPVRVHGVAAKNLGSGNAHNDFLRPDNLDMYAPALFDILDEAYDGPTRAA
jgi:acyl-CoA synthetase (AMP-forming)/AMP-acid ligase II/aryl carrier-like protein